MAQRPPKSNITTQLQPHGARPRDAAEERDAAPERIAPGGLAASLTGWRPGRRGRRERPDAAWLPVAWADAPGEPCALWTPPSRGSWDDSLKQRGTRQVAFVTSPCVLSQTEPS